MPQQSEHHPWKKRQGAQIAAARSGEKAKRPRNTESVGVWTCPACGLSTCCYGECTDAVETRSKCR